MSLTLTLATALKKTVKNSYHVVLVDDNSQTMGQLTSELQTAVSRLIEASRFKGKLADTAISYGTDNNTGLLLVGVGSQDKLNGGSLQKIAKAIYASLSRLTKSAVISLGDSMDEVSFGQLALALLNQSYTFDIYKSQKADKPTLKDVTLLVSADNQPAFDTLLQLQHATAQGQSLTKDLANQPPNVCFPAYLAEQAQSLANQYPELLTVKVLGEKDMQQLGMNCFLAVARGSAHEAKLVLLEYNGKAAKKDKNSKTKGKKSSLEQPIVLVGKGITFDSGGISLKPGLGMGEMKYDMGGAAAVMGIIKALCEARLPLQVVGALACAENMPSGTATRPGDIVTAMNGKTVEILNTDAEGRLVLCDTLVYVQRYQPKVIIDMATLTGACIVALGYVRSGLYGNNEDVIFELEQASESAYDRVWHMPLDDDYQEQLKSNMADMQNIGGMPAGSVTAACFLSKFVEDIPWAHLDIAGTAWQSGKEPTATGRPVPLLMHYLYRQAAQDAV